MWECLGIYKTEKHHGEMRARIVMEMVLNEQLYLNDVFLAIGHGGESLSEKYVQYTEQDAGEPVRGHPCIVQRLYEESVFAFRINTTYGGMFEMHALASVLHTNIYSCYPVAYGYNVRQDMHRLLKPKVPADGIAYILWSNVAVDSNPGTWWPNHFVLPLGLNVRRDA